MRTLTIISHTEHYHRTDGSVVGLASTVTEINHLLEVFDAIIHVAMLHEIEAPENTLPYSSDRITFVALPAVGGPSVKDKLAVLSTAPKVISIINTCLAQSSYFHFRAPTGIGVYMIPYLIWYSAKKGWFKYAGNWKQEQAPLAYKIQRWFLVKQSRAVTINGVWAHQPHHCLSFENPCLTTQEMEVGKVIKANKTFHYPLSLCFVGRLEPAKGVDKIISSIKGLNESLRTKIGVIRMVGTGGNLMKYQKQVEQLDLPIKFLGILSRSEVHEIYKTSHAIILPSLSEGFPKVIAEAMNYGCVPIVSNVSSMSQYIRHGENGFLMETISSTALQKALEHFLNLSESEFKNLTQFEEDVMEKFTYGYYNQRIVKEIL
jgi:glycosyltransferase involved in cell wall biosynthesis